jgi:hypothetical protein
LQAVVVQLLLGIAAVTLHLATGEQRQLVELLEGSGTFRVTNAEGKFTVVTRVGSVTAIATEFSVKIPSPQDQGESGMKVRCVTLAVAVLVGTVQVDFGGRTYFLSSGDNRVFAKQQEAAKPQAAEPGKTLEVKLGAAIPRSWDDVKKGGYAYGPKQESDPSTQETHIWLPYGNKGEYFEMNGVKFTDPGTNTGWPLAVTVDDHTNGRLVYKFHFDKPIESFRFYVGWSEWGVGGDTVGGVEYSVDGRKWTTIRQLDEAKAHAQIIDQFVDGKKTYGGLNTQDLYICCYSRDKNHPDAESGPGRWMKFCVAGDPKWGDAAKTFFDRQLQLWVTPATGPTVAVKANDFLNSIGACTHVRQGEDDPAKVAECLSYIGIRAIRDDGTTDAKILQKFIDIHNKSGAKVALLSINGEIHASLNEYETLAAAGALLAADGPNEPNNWKVTYKGESSSNKTSLPIARFQADLYAAVKADPKLAGIPVFHSSEAGGSEPDNCGLQYLTIPKGAGCLMPDGTKFADYANPHNYVCDHLKGITEDNIAWNAESPTLRGKWDGLQNEYGHTWWGKGFDGYTPAQLTTLPRVTTETGWSTKSGGGGHTDGITEEEQGKLFVNLYLDAFKRGWAYTFIYMLHDSKGQGAWGFVRGDYSHKPSADYLHNLTTLLADKSSGFTPRKLDYSISDKPVTVHDMLIEKSDGTLALAVWDERAKGSDDVTVKFAAPQASVKIYDPTRGTVPIRTLAHAASLPLTLSDHALIIEIAAPVH